MSTVQEALRVIRISLKYYLHSTIVLQNRAYIVIGEVQDLANAYVCIGVDEQNDDLMHSLMLVEVDPASNSVQARAIQSGESLHVGEGQRASCMMLVALTARAFNQIVGEVPPPERVEGLVAFAGLTIDHARAAGVFNGRQSYDELMAFGAYRPPSNRRHRSRQGGGESRELNALRRSCRFGDPASIRAYGSILIAAKVMELYDDEDAS